jgi:hypothetical protein
MWPYANSKCAFHDTLRSATYVTIVSSSIVTITHLGFYNWLIKWLFFFLTIVITSHVNDYVVVKDITMPHDIIVLRL